MRVDPIDVADGSGCNKGATVENNAKEDEWSWLDGLENMTSLCIRKVFDDPAVHTVHPISGPSFFLESMLCLRLVLAKI